MRTIRRVRYTWGYEGPCWLPLWCGECEGSLGRHFFDSREYPGEYFDPYDEDATAQYSVRECPHCLSENSGDIEWPSIPQNSKQVR